MLTPAEAEKLIQAVLSPAGTEDCPLAEAHGRVLRREIRADKTMRYCGKSLHVHVLRERHSPRVDLQNLQAPCFVWHGDDDLTVEPPGPP